MENTSKIDSSLLQIIQTESRKQAEAVYAEKGTQYNVASVPAHVHNGVDSNTLPQFVPVSNGVNGVLGGFYTSDQIVNLNPATGQGNSNVYTVPAPIIYGHGVGTASQFNGGEAPVGTILLFSNPPLIIQLWWRAIDVNGVAQWYGVDVAAGYGNPATALGPLP